MSRGKHLSLEEARKSGQIKQFCKEHPSKGDEKLFDKTLDMMAPRAKSLVQNKKISKKGGKISEKS